MLCNVFVVIQIDSASHIVLKIQANIYSRYSLHLLNKNFNMFSLAFYRRCRISVIYYREIFDSSPRLEHIQIYWDTELVFSL